MTTPADIQTLLFTEAIRLVSPGGDFELGEEDVLGSTMQVFVNRGRRLHEVVGESVKWGDREYVVSDDERLTFAEHARQVSAFAKALQEEHGVGPGDRVAIASANSPAWITAFWATVSIGAIAVGCNAWWTRREMDSALELTTPALVLADAKRQKVLEGVDAPVLPLAGAVSEAAARYPDAPLPSCEGSEDDPAVILFTSGTSGRAKGAAHSHRNLMSVIEYHRFNDAMTKVMGGPEPEDRRYLLALPLFHVAGLHNLAVPRLATGSKVVLHVGAFDADRVLRLIERERVTNWGAVPTMASRLLELGDLSAYDTSSLTSFALASAPSSPAFKERLRQNVPFAANALVDSYGLTETSTGVSVASPMDLAESPGTLGRPIMTVKVEIRDEDGNALPEGQEGEICVRSPFNMLCYWNDEAATAATLREDRWLHTGDIGVMEGGRLRLSTRRSDLILRGGENVYPVEVEGVLTEHPDVEECVVMGVDHPDLGEEVGAVVVLREGASTTEEELRTWAADQLAYYKVPSRWRFRSEPLPRTATQKVVRREVADLV